MSSALLNKIKNRVRSYLRQIKNFNILANIYGQWATIRERDCKDSAGDPIPWYTYPAIEYLMHLNLSGMSVFEYGSGNSTIWWARNALKVHSVEDDSTWLLKIQETINKGRYSIKYDFKERKEDYVNACVGVYDITIFDGKFRSDCVRKYLENSIFGAMLIFDNSDRYPFSMEKIRRKLKWVELDFHGFGPINGYTWTTSIFINPAKLNEIKYKKNLASLSGLNQNMEQN